MRFALDWCVFGYPNNPNQTLAYVSCNEACSDDDANMEASLEYQVLNTTISQETPFQYCDLYSGAYTKNADACLQCLEKVPGSTALANCEHLSIPNNRAYADGLYYRYSCVAKRMSAATGTWKRPTDQE